MFIRPKKVYSVAQVRELDRIAIEENKIPSFSLMKNAGAATFDILKKFFPKAKNITVVCGKGNNAGDGYVIAKLAKEDHLKVKVLSLSEVSKLRGDALRAAKECQSVGIKPEVFQAAKLANTDVIVDALLGTGLQGNVNLEYKNAIAALNKSSAKIIAVDIPSGLDADTGNPLGIAVKAEVTVTFVGCKKGLFTAQAKDYCGKVFFADLNIPAKVYQRVHSSVEIIKLEEAKLSLPTRRRSAFKNNFGHALLVGGDYGMAGAIAMAACAAARSGSGLTSVVTRLENVSIVTAIRPEIMCYGVNFNTMGRLKTLLTRANVLVIGPGLGGSQWSETLWQELVLCPQPKVIDADGLNILAKKPFRDHNRIITPHPGEAARLLGCDSEKIQQDRFAAVTALQSKFGGVCVLKGAGTLVMGDDGKIWLCTAGNPGMASGGMGDILSGIIAGLLAQGLSLINAAKLGVLVHSLAADKAAARCGERGLLAMDLLPYLRELIN